MRLLFSLALSLATALCATSFAAPPPTEYYQPPGKEYLVPVGKPDPFAIKADEPAKKADEKKYARGLKMPSDETLKKRHADAFKRHGHRMKALPEATPATFDIDALGWGTPILDQGNCGSCWCVSGIDTITCAYVKAGQVKGDGSFLVSPQYVMDCEDTGGCNGDDAPHVFEIAKAKGIPSEKDYGAYQARSSTCKFKSGTVRYAVKDYIFATSGQQYGFATTQEVKNAVVAYGMINTAIAANSDWDNLGAGGGLQYRKLGENSIDHDVNVVGWDDAKQIPGAPAPGAFKVKNQWGKGWGAKGYLWVAYGSHAIGYEACAVYVNTPLPPPPGPDPTPVPPTPDPTPVPPGPGGTFTGTIAVITSYVNGVAQPGPVTAINVSLTIEGYLKGAGFNPAVIADILKLAADMQAKPRNWGLILQDALKIATDLGLMKDAEQQDNAIPQPMPEKKPLGWLRREETTTGLAA